MNTMSDSANKPESAGTIDAEGNDLHQSETPMQRMQREALEEQAAADAARGNASLDEIRAMQQEALAEQLASDQRSRQGKSLREVLNRYLFDMSWTGGKLVNYSILLLIITTVLTSMFNTLPEVNETWGAEIVDFQIVVLYVFLAEYVLRIYAARERKKYALGFYGIVDLLTVLPLFFGNSGSALMRLFRLIRIIRLGHYFPILVTLFRSVSDAKGMILAVLATIMAVSVLTGNLAYLLEPETFKNAFVGTWWSLVTMSTVGYGDLVPKSSGGMILGGVLILLGICVVAMMTAVIAVRVGRMVNMTNKCFECSKPVAAEHRYCPHCGQDQSDNIDLFTDDD
ncbi:ion transporter [Mariprofundus erugo]|uniref:ion transporter n=1 Tax=Mariprofundus erugo TaxID=2528639 RepID=UPI0010FE4748|nr:ion transporter [Mariprofundus erugo]TLS78211.1 ion transporter [Mariprofundus erugo]